jgi:hypothetical protein
MYSLLTTLWLALAGPAERKTSPRRRPAFRRPILEALEDRTVPSNFTAATVSDLIADINAANLAGGSNTITLVAGNIFNVEVANNTTDGMNGLPVIAANDNLTIVGNGDYVFGWDLASGQAPYRLFDVALGASLTIENASLDRGYAYGSSVSAEGGAILNRGALTLNAVLIGDSQAVGGNYDYPPESGAGGGIYSSGSLTLEGGTQFVGNEARGTTGGYRAAKNGWSYGVPGGDGLGGAVYVAGGTATLDTVTLQSNWAIGGDGGEGTKSLAAGGLGKGGALYVAAGTVTLTGVTLSSNWAIGGIGNPGGNGYGGALYVAGGTVALSSGTLSSNKALGGNGESNPLLGYYRIWPKYGTNAGNGYGGGLCVAGGTVTLTSEMVLSNTAVGGVGGYGYLHPGVGGNAYGGALYAFGGTTTLRTDTVTGNSAQGGTSNTWNGEPAGIGEGGGLCIVSPGIVYLDAFTLANTINNTPDNIYGPYTEI